jgi:tetratricopeptide (TPR) repeat protein
MEKCMSGLILCSRKADVPYRIADADLNIYSIEEFAYYLYNNAYFVDDGFFNGGLCDYIENNLNLPKVAQKLMYAMGQRMNFAELVMIIIKSSRYYSETEIKAFEKELKTISSKGMLERMKTRADMLFENGKLGSALKTYENILNNNIYKRESNEFYAGVYLGIGKIEGRMFYLKEALEKFKHSYELKPSDEALKEIINVKFAMKYSGIKEDIDFTKENEINSELVLKCSEEVKDIWEQINNGTEYENLSQTFIYDGRHNLDDYYVNVQEVLDEWKNDYRSNIG